MKFPKRVAVAFLFALALCSVGFCKAAHAEDRPLFAWERLSFAGGVNYAWHAAPAEAAAPLPLAVKEWEAGAYAAYNLTPMLSLAASSVYGFDNQHVVSRVGLRVRLGRGE